MLQSALSAPIVAPPHLCPLPPPTLPPPRLLPLPPPPSPPLPQARLRRGVASAQHEPTGRTPIVAFHCPSSTSPPSPAPPPPLAPPRLHRLLLPPPPPAPRLTPRSAVVAADCRFGLLRSNVSIYLSLATQPTLSPFPIPLPPPQLIVPRITHLYSYVVSTRAPYIQDYPRLLRGRYPRGNWGNGTWNVQKSVTPG